MDYSLSTNGTDEEACTPFQNAPSSDLLCLFLGTVTFVTLCGNLLVIVSILYFRQLRSPSNLLVLSLALSDLLVGIVVLPFSIILFVTPCWHLHSILCRVRSSFDIMLSISSILNLSFSSVERYYAVCRPLSYKTKMNTRVIAAMISVSWAVAACCGLVMTFGGQKYEKRCAFFQNLKLGAVAAVVALYIPAVIMLTIYTKIFLVVRKQVHSIHLQNQGAAVSKVERKATLTLALVVGVFLCCWAPFFITVTYLPFQHFSIPLSLMEAFKLLGWCNSMLNPFIYAFCYSWFRSTSRMILSGRIFTQKCSNTRLY